MSEHTKGPWAVNFTKFSEVRAENGAVIARCVKLASLTNLEANARRIVACVNACEGVSTKHLENNLPIRELVTRYNEALREIEALKTARTELANALGELADEVADRFDLDSPSTNPPIKHAVSSARIAITKAAEEPCTTNEFPKRTRHSWS